ncbi:MAG TPA: uroporphyrinogen decarboxylase [Candidatus Aphodovivens avistercoris]|nr:uroporphyrinogen decarboxylase [Candidatus Aphodovivens avistercoris]
MLTKRQNLLECIHGGKPDRYVNQWEAFAIVRGNPVCDRTTDENGQMTDEWGVLFQVAGQPGRMPLNDGPHLVVKDIDEWKDYLKTVPRGVWSSPAQWEPLQEKAEKVDRDEQFVMALVSPGQFERLHYLCGMADALMALYESPDEVKEILDVITEVELEQAEAICTYLKPDGIVHADDWGTAKSTFMKPEMFEEFFLERYKKVYGYYKSHGVQLIVHHSDTYAATLVPYMIEMGIDIWQGCLLDSNDLPDLVRRYGGKLSFMGGIASTEADRADWTPESVRAVVDDALNRMEAKTFYIPCLTSGAPASTFPGVYDEVTRCIAERSRTDW